MKYKELFCKWKKKRKGKIQFHTLTKHLSHTTSKPLHHKALGGVFLFFFTFSIHIRSDQSLPYLVYYWSKRGAGVIAQSSAQGSLQNSPIPAELMPHKSCVGGIILADKSGFMSACVSDIGTIIIRGDRKEIKHKLEASGMFLYIHFFHFWY